MYRIDICTAYSGFIYRAFRKTGSKGIYRQVRKAYIDSGKMRGRRPRRWQRSCHRGGEAARGVGAADPASLAEL
ncbi:hypothetical protein NQ317_010413, partial [Molorchus minor]